MGSDDPTKAVERVVGNLFGEGKTVEIPIDEYVVKLERYGEELVYILISSS